MVSGFRRKDGPGALLNPLMVCHEIAWKPGEGHEARRKTYLLGTPLASSPVPLARTSALAADTLMSTVGKNRRR